MGAMLERNGILKQKADEGGRRLIVDCAVLTAFSVSRDARYYSCEGGVGRTGITQLGGHRSQPPCSFGVLLPYSAVP